MSALGDARLLLARRAHRKVIGDRLADAYTTIVAARGNGSLNAFGTRLDPDIADRLGVAAAEIEACIGELRRRNESEAA